MMATLTWTESVAPGGMVNLYEIHRKKTSAPAETEFTVIDTFDVDRDMFGARENVLEYEDVSAVPGQTYLYFVRGVAVDGRSSDSNQVSGSGGGGGSGTTILLVHADGTNGQQTFTDSSSYAHVLATQQLGLTTVSTTDPKFGTGSIACASGVSSDSIVVTEQGAEIGGEFDLSTRDWTVEAWVYYDPAISGDAVYSQILYLGLDSAAYFPAIDFYIFNGSTILAYGIAENDSDEYQVNGSITALTWTHVAVVREGQEFRLYVNGVLDDSVTVAAPIALFYTNRKLSIGADQLSDLHMKGKIDELRISHAALYTANFTPPVAPFPDG